MTGAAGLPPRSALSARQRATVGVSAVGDLALRTSVASVVSAAVTPAVLAANQGLYNGFLAAGLVWGLMTDRRDIKVFFLACVIVAGVYGGLTAKTTILYIQALPGFLALLAVLAARPARVRPHL